MKTELMPTAEEIKRASEKYLEESGYGRDRFEVAKLWEIGTDTLQVAENVVNKYIRRLNENYEMHVICEMALAYLDTIKEQEQMMYTEIEHDNDVMNAYEDGRRHGYEQGRLDAIEEYRREMHDMIVGNEEFIAWQKHEICECNELVAEQLREKD